MDYFSPKVRPSHIFGHNSFITQQNWFIPPPFFSKFPPDLTRKLGKVRSTRISRNLCSDTWQMDRDPLGWWLSIDLFPNLERAGWISSSVSYIFSSPPQLEGWSLYCSSAMLSRSHFSLNSSSRLSVFWRSLWQFMVFLCDGAIPLIWHE